MTSTEKITVGETFALRLREVREKKNLNKREMAEFLGFRPPVYWRYEDGRLPDADTISVIANHLGVSIDWLLGRDALEIPEQTGTRQDSPTEPTEPSSELSKMERMEKRLSRLEQACIGIDGQLDEIRRLLISLLAAEHREADAPRESESEKGVKAG